VKERDRDLTVYHVAGDCELEH